MSLDLEFIEKETNIGADFVLVAKLALPCGHDVEHSAIFRDYQESQFDIKQVREMAQKRLVYWFEIQVPWHDCEKVGDGNPNGLIPRDQRTSKTGPYSITKAAQTA